MNFRLDDLFDAIVVALLGIGLGWVAFAAVVGAR
jgi:hypothetical protein